MKADELSQKYANAIFSFALETWLSSLNTVQQRLADNPKLAESLQDVERTFAEKQKDLDGIIPAGIDQSVRNFMYTLLKNGDIDLLGNVLASLEQISRGGPQVQVAYVTSAAALAEKEKAQFQQKLRAQYGANLELDFRIDPSIIGGAIVQVGDQVIDGSVATRLEAMNNALGVKR